MNNITKIATELLRRWLHNWFFVRLVLIAINLSKQKALDADTTAIQQINLTANLDRAGNSTIFVNML